MHRVPNGFTTSLNFKLSDRVPADKAALAEGGTVLQFSILQKTNYAAQDFYLSIFNIPYYLRLVRSTRCEGLLSGNYGEVNL